jgi:hypothetical protein
MIEIRPPELQKAPPRPIAPALTIEFVRLNTAPLTVDPSGLLSDSKGRNKKQRRLEKVASEHPRGVPLVAQVALASIALMFSMRKEHLRPQETCCLCRLHLIAIFSLNHDECLGLAQQVHFLRPW